MLHSIRCTVPFFYTFRIYIHSLISKVTIQTKRDARISMVRKSFSVREITTKSKDVILVIGTNLNSVL